MNAKFEKWCEDNFYVPVKEDRKLWQAAIQSLEVTPELVTLTTIAYTGFEPHPHDVLFMEQALKAFLSALKEQAK